MIDDIKYWKGSSVIGPPLAMFDADKRDWAMVVYQPEKPVLDGELNLMQQATNRRLRDLLRGIFPKGGALKELAPTATGVANEVRVHTEGKPLYIILDGIMKPVYGFDDPASATATEGGNRVTLPTYSSGSYTELVYLEVWFEEVMASTGGAGTDSGGDPASADTTVYEWGMVANRTLNNDIAVSGVPMAESTRRIQLRGELKVHKGSSISGVKARGVTGYGFSLLTGTNTYRAGGGTEADGDALDTVDGYCYAIPLVKITRHASTVVQDDIELATDIIPTGSDVADQIIALQGRATSLETRMTTAEGDIDGLDDDLGALASRVTTAEGDIVSLQGRATIIESALPTFLKLSGGTMTGAISLRENAGATFPVTAGGDSYIRRASGSATSSSLHVSMGNPTIGTQEFNLGYDDGSFHSLLRVLPSTDEDETEFVFTGSVQVSNGLSVFGSIALASADLTGSLANPSRDGFMSKTDKSRLDQLWAAANP